MAKHLKLWVAAFALAFVFGALHAEDAEALSTKYFEQASSEKGEADAKKTGAAFIEAAKGDADGLNEFAWKLLTDENIKKRDMELAMKAAKAAVDASEGKSAAIVDTYAKAFFDSGKIEEGLKWQKKAVELCTDDNLKGELTETLKTYQAKVDEKAKGDKKEEKKEEKKDDKKDVLSK